MNKAQIASLVRTFLKIGSGLLIAHGMQKYATVLNTPDVVGAVTLIASLLWSHFNHANQPGATTTKSIPLHAIAPFVLAIGFAALMTGCKSPQLQAGGAYAPAVVTTNADGSVTSTATQAPDQALFVADSAYKLAYDAIDGVFKWEYENRAQLQKQFPQLKPALDKLRPEVWKIDQRWAIARKAYLANPTPANLTAVQNIIAKIERLVPVAQAEMTAQLKK